MFYKEKEKNFKEYFYYGIENKEEVFDYIMYRAFKEFHDSVGNVSGLYKLSHEEQMNQILGIAKKYYKQFYRFVIANDDPTNKEYKTENENDILTEKARNKFQEGLQKHEIEEYNIGYFLNGDKERSLIEIEKESKCGNKSVGWADIVYTFLKELAELEQRDIEKYKIEWFKVRMARAINRKEPNREEINYLLGECKTEIEKKNIDRDFRDGP